RVDDLQVRVLRDLAAGTPWPEDDADQVAAMFCAHPPANLAAFPRLRWIQIDSAGFSHLFPHRLAEKGITVTNARGLFDCPIAEWNVAMMINLVRDVRTLIRHQ